MACEQNIIDVPVSASMPAPTDLVLFTLADGTSVLRTWSVILAGQVPDDEEYTVAASGSATNNIVNGNSSFILTNFIGRRVRLNRNGIPQGTTVQPGGSYYSFNSSTGTFTVTPVPATGEIFQIQAY